MSHVTHTIEVFSAREFFSGLVKRSTERPGHVVKNLVIPEVGFHIAHEGSLEWIDSLFVSGAEVEGIIAAIKKGELPPAVISSAPRSIEQHFTYISPELLSRSSGTILAAFGLVEDLVSLALDASFATCSACGSPALPTHSPLELIERIYADWAQETITITATSSEPQFAEWASEMGFRVSRQEPLKTYSAHLDAGPCSKTLLTSLSSALSSLWRVPGVVVRCHSDTGSGGYSMYGWCSRCEVSNPAPCRDTLHTLLEKGVVRHGQTAASHQVELCLGVTDYVTVKDLCVQPIAAMQVTTEPLLAAKKYLQIMGLGERTFLTPTSSLSSRDNAALSAAICLYRSSRTNSSIVLDLPSGIFHQGDTNAIRDELIFSSTTTCIVCLNDPFTAPIQDTQKTCIKRNAATAPIISLDVGDSSRSAVNIYPGDIVDAGEACTVRELLRIQEENSAIRVVPLFPAPPNAKGVLGGELGILDKLAKLYAASLDARSAGLTAKDFSLSSVRANPNLCGECNGLGVVLTWHPAAPRPQAAQCPLCAGARCKPAVSSMRFRGVSFQEMLNQTLTDSSSTLQALSNAKEALTYADLLGLNKLPLGMPLTLLSASETRKLRILSAVLDAKPNKPIVIAIESPEVGFSLVDRERIKTFQRLPSIAEKCAWLEITTLTPSLLKGAKHVYS